MQQKQRVVTVREDEVFAGTEDMNKEQTDEAVMRYLNTLLERQNAEGFRFTSAAPLITTENVLCLLFTPGNGAPQRLMRHRLWGDGDLAELTRDDRATLAKLRLSEELAKINAAGSRVDAFILDEDGWLYTVVTEA